MTSLHVPHVPRHSMGFRGNRLAQPDRNRETQKRPQADTSNHIDMPDGGLVSPHAFHQMRSNSHKVLGADLTGCAKRVIAFATPAQKTKIEAWFRTHRNRKAHVETANDHLLAVLLDYAGGKMKNKLNAFSVYALILECENVHMLVPPN